MGLACHFDIAPARPFSGRHIVGNNPWYRARALALNFGSNMDPRFIAFGLAIGTGLGVALGAAIGAVTKNVGLWVALGISLGAGIGLSVGAAIAVILQRAPEGICPKCGYSMKGLSSTTCPECGADISEQETDESPATTD
jgi:hypothetical protein